MIPITESTLPDLMNLNRLMYSKYSRLTGSNVKIKLVAGVRAAWAPPPPLRSRFLRCERSGPPVTDVPFRAKAGGAQRDKGDGSHYSEKRTKGDAEK